MTTSRSTSKQRRTRLVPAPPAEGRGAENRVRSVRVAHGEDVLWLWTPLPGGGRFVSGYEVVPRPAESERAG